MVTRARNNFIEYKLVHCQLTMRVTEVSHDYVLYDTGISTCYFCGQTCKDKRSLFVHKRRCSKRHIASMVEFKKTDSNSVYAETNGNLNTCSVIMTDIKQNVDKTSQINSKSGADSFNLLIAVRPVVSRKSQPTGHVSATCISSDQCQSHDPKLRRKLHHNSNLFIIRRYNNRIKKVSRMW